MSSPSAATQLTGDPAAARRRVTMLVRNRFTHDSRVEKEARTLARAGYQVTVVADGGPGLPAREARDGYAVVRVPFASGPPVARFFRRRALLEAAVAATEPEVLHAHDTNALEPVARVAERLGVPFVLDAHELWLGQTRRQRGPAYWAAYLAYWALVERRYLSRAAAVVAATDPICRILERRYHPPVARTVLNLPELHPEAPARDLRSLPGGSAITHGAPILLYLGGIQEGRGLEQIVDALPDIPDAELALLGSGPSATAIRARAQARGVIGRIHLLEPVPPAEVVSYAASATIGLSLIQPVSASYRYSLPNKLFEYLAAGIPVVASDFPQVREILVPNDAGRVVDPRDPARIAATIRDLLADPALRAMGRRGRRLAESRFEWSASAATLLEVYAGISGAVQPDPPA